MLIHSFQRNIPLKWLMNGGIYQLLSKWQLDILREEMHIEELTNSVVCAISSVLRCSVPKSISTIQSFQMHISHVSKSLPALVPPERSNGRNQLGKSQQNKLERLRVICISGGFLENNFSSLNLVFLLLAVLYSKVWDSGLTCSSSRNTAWFCLKCQTH